MNIYCNVGGKEHEETFSLACFQHNIVEIAVIFFFIDVFFFFFFFFLSQILI